MGWCNGTEIFDTIADVILSDKKIDKKETLKIIITALQDADWDCIEESRYIDHPLVKESLVEIDPDWKEYFDDDM